MVDIPPADRMAFLIAENGRLEEANERLTRACAAAHDAHGAEIHAHKTTIEDRDRARRRATAIETQLDELRAYWRPKRPDLARAPGLNPGSVLVEAELLINGDRRTDYGSPLQSFGDIAELATVGLRHKLDQALTAEDIAWVLLFALKGSRAAAGLRTGTFHRDTYIDVAGYAGCAELIHNERAEAANPQIVEPF